MAIIYFQLKKLPKYQIKFLKKEQFDIQFKTNFTSDDN